MRKRPTHNVFQVNGQVSRWFERGTVFLMYSLLSAAMLLPVCMFGLEVFRWSKIAFTVFVAISVPGSASIFFTYAVPEAGKKLGFPYVWTLLRYLFPPGVRERNFDLVVDELRQDYQEAKRYKKRWVRAWLFFCFTVRTLLAVLDTFRAVVVDKLIWLLPDSLRTWWRRG